MPAVDLVDETFIAADPHRIAAVVADRDRWRQWWPDLKMTVFMDRGVKGIRWSVVGAFVGSAEIWIEPCFDGAIVHYYLRLDPTPSAVDVTNRSDGGSVDQRGRPLSPRLAARVRASRAQAWKRIVWSLKDELEAGRGLGLPVNGPGSDALVTKGADPVRK